MSGEFGESVGGYFHDKIHNAAEDCQGSRDELTRLFGALLDELYPVARAISWHEAADSGPDEPIFALIYGRRAIQLAWQALQNHVATYEDVAERAIRDAARKPEAQ